jgi:hypothetical protein
MRHRPVYEWLSRGSADHVAKINSNTLEIWPTENTKEALERFQPIARKALDHAGEGYTILKTRQSPLYSGDLYNWIVLKPDEATD